MVITLESLFAPRHTLYSHIDIKQTNQPTKNYKKPKQKDTMKQNHSKPILYFILKTISIGFK